MKRLTKKTENGYKLKIDNIEWASNKLGKIEDLLDEYKIKSYKEIIKMFLIAEIVIKDINDMYFITPTTIDERG